MFEQESKNVFSLAREKTWVSLNAHLKRHEKNSYFLVRSNTEFYRADS